MVIPAPEPPITVNPLTRVHFVIQGVVAKLSHIIAIFIVAEVILVLQPGILLLVQPFPVLDFMGLPPQLVPAVGIDALGLIAFVERTEDRLEMKNVKIHVEYVIVDHLDPEFLLAMSISAEFPFGEFRNC